LVNPLQGEGISQALQSGRWAAEAILGASAGAAGRYRARLVAHHLPYQRITAALQGAVIRRPRAMAALARFLVAATRNDTVAGGWAVFWNELFDGSPPGSHRTVAALITHLGSALTARTEVARWLEADQLAHRSELQLNTLTELTYQPVGPWDTEISNTWSDGEAPPGGP
jgi:flavin-dependent dehydrogenase